jgi:hypothetical protein
MSRKDRPSWAFRCLAAALAVMVAGCAGVGSPAPSSQAPAAVCELPLAGPAAAAACQGNAEVLAREEGSSGGKSTLQFRIAIPDQEPTVIMAALTRAALDHRGEADELTFLAFGDATEATGVTYTRGRLVVQADGTAAYDLCTAWNDSGGKAVCADQIAFTVGIFE